MQLNMYGLFDMLLEQPTKEDTIETLRKIRGRQENEKFRFVGHYTVVRYVLDLIWEEFINVGVILLSPEQICLGFRFNLTKAEKWFPTSVDVVEAIANELSSLVLRAGEFMRLGEKYFRYCDREYAKLLSEQFCYHVRFTPPRAALFDDFDAELEDLYCTFVG